MELTTFAKASIFLSCYLSLFESFTSSTGTRTPNICTGTTMIKILTLWRPWYGTVSIVTLECQMVIYGALTSKTSEAVKYTPLLYMYLCQVILNSSWNDILEFWYSIFLALRTNQQRNLTSTVLSCIPEHNWSICGLL